MGLVYRAFDTTVRRLVALKTIRDMPSRVALDLFRRECDVLASISHPNIVEIFDIGEFQEDNEAKPYFVMPLLRGSTLEEIIRNSRQRLTQERTIEIAVHICRGLQAAHEHGLVHRDLKPSNIFVMQDDSVKIIDFGVAHMADTGVSMSIKGGTLQYMAPEQIQLRPPSPLSDIFSLGVVCYQTLSGRRPFQGNTENEIARAILEEIPPLVSDLNPAVSPVISRVIHKSMAKQPWHRFASARDFGEMLRKALANEPIEIFDSARIAARIGRASKAFEDGNLQFAAEILSDLEAEGQFDSAMPRLRRQIEDATRQKTVQHLIETARARMEQEEYLLALQKVDEALELDRDNVAARSLRGEIDNKRSEHKIEEWLRLARKHLENHAFGHARSAMENLLQLKPKEARALQLLQEIGRQEEEFLRIRHEKERLYQGALNAWHSGEMSSALSKLEKLLELDKQAPDTSSESAAAYQNLFNQVRSEYDVVQNAYAEARRLCGDQKYAAAAAICDEYLVKYPNHAVFQALKFDIDDRQRQERSACVAQVDRQVESEPDLDRRLSILREALERYPDEPHLERLYRRTSEKREFVQGVVAKAGSHEQLGQFTEALGQWQILQTVHPEYPGIALELERIARNREHQLRVEARVRAVEQVRRLVEAREFTRAADAARTSLQEFPGDPEFAELERAAQAGAERLRQASALLASARELQGRHRFDQALEALREALAADNQNPAIRQALVESLLERGRTLLDGGSANGRQLVDEALDLDPGNMLGRSLQSLFLERERDTLVAACLGQVQALEAAGDLRGAILQLDQALALYPREHRLLERRSALSERLDKDRSGREKPLDAHQPAAPVPESWTALARPDQTEFKIPDPDSVLQPHRTQFESPEPPPPAMPDEAELSDRKRSRLTVVVVLLTVIVGALAGMIAAAYMGFGSDTGRQQAVRLPQPAERAESDRPTFGEASKEPEPAPAPAAASVESIPATPRAPGVHRVSIATDPPDALIEVDAQTDSVQTCRSPCDLRLPAGRHTLSAVLEGYRKALKVFEVQRQVEVGLPLIKQFGTVMINAQVPGASIILNGQERPEKSPAVLNLSPGQYTLTIVTDKEELTTKFDLQDGAILTFGGHTPR
jgi:serine/threonine-protein kinase